MLKILRAMFTWARGCSLFLFIGRSPLLRRSERRERIRSRARLGVVEYESKLELCFYGEE